MLESNSQLKKEYLIHPEGRNLNNHLLSEKIDHGWKKIMNHLCLTPLIFLDLYTFICCDVYIGDFICNKNDTDNSNDDMCKKKR